MQTRLRIASLALALAAAPALAQDVGFFRPAADPALTPARPLPPAPPAQPQPPQAPQVSETAQMAAAELAATRQEDALRWAEQQMDRAEQEAAELRTPQHQAVPGVGAAFSGSTSER